MRAHLVEPDACRPLQAFEGTERERLFAAGIRNELLVQDAGARWISGIDGLRVLLARSGRPRAAALLGCAPVRGLATVLYRLVAANRRVIAPVDEAQRVACDCDPEPRAGYRFAFVVLCFALACGGAAGLGALLATFAGAGGSRGAALGLAAPALLALPALLVLPGVPTPRRSEGVAHLALQTVLAVLAAARSVALLVVAFAVVLGALFLLARALRWVPPLRLFADLYPFVWPTILGVASVAAVHVFVRGLARRLRALGWAG